MAPRAVGVTFDGGTRRRGTRAARGPTLGLEKPPETSGAPKGADDERRAFLIRPAVRLDDAKRYIVAIRDVVDGDGALIAPSEGFLALRDDGAADDPAINDRRALYDNIFRELEGAGVPRDDLQLAWDFTTASRDDTTAWMLHMRDVALEMTPASGPSYLLDSVTPNWAPGIAFRVLVGLVRHNPDERRRHARELIAELRRHDQHNVMRSELDRLHVVLERLSTGALECSSP